MYQETEEIEQTFPDPPSLVRQNAITPVYTTPPLLERSIAMTYVPDIYGFYPNDYVGMPEIEQNNKTQLQIEIILLKIKILEQQIEKLKQRINKVL